MEDDRDFKAAWKSFFFIAQEALMQVETLGWHRSRIYVAKEVLQKLIDFGDSENFQEILREFSRNHSNGNESEHIKSQVILNGLYYEMEDVVSNWRTPFLWRRRIVEFLFGMKIRTEKMKPFSIAIKSLQDLLNLPAWVNNSLTLLDEIFQLMDTR